MRLHLPRMKFVPANERPNQVCWFEPCDSVLDCGSPLPLSRQARNRRLDAGSRFWINTCFQSGRGLPQSKTWRKSVVQWCVRASPVFFLGLLGSILLAGGGDSLAADSLVLTQTPVTPPSGAPARTILDQRYPNGSRVVLMAPPYRTNTARVLSAGLTAAGGPVVYPDGNHILFVGKTSVADAWQVYLTTAKGGRPKPLTAMTEGAMDPAVIANGDFVFSSPVPKVGEVWKTDKPAALYAKKPGMPPRQLTFGTYSAVEPTVLRDGRILFISAHPAADSVKIPSLGLFTINNDGTEVTAFALDRDEVSRVHRPRELGNGELGFVATTHDEKAAPKWAEAVRMARPFASRSQLFAFPTGSCLSVEPDGPEALLACFETRGMSGRSMRGSYAVFCVNPDAKELGRPLFDDPAWHDIEAVRLTTRSEPMGHVSAIVPSKPIGTILCLNASSTRPGASNTVPSAKVGRVRVLARTVDNQERVLGEITVQGDGSFMATVPAETPIGFETLDDQGHVAQRLAPSIWLRRGENRSCLGCHEPYNRAPRNVRPIAAGLPAVNLGDRTTVAGQ